MIIVKGGRSVLARYEGSYPTAVTMSFPELVFDNSQFYGMEKRGEKGELRRGEKRTEGEETTFSFICSLRC